MSKRSVVIAGVLLAVPATERALVLVDGRLQQGHFEDGHVRLTLPGGRYDILVVAR